MRRNEAPVLQQVYRLRPDSVGDKNGGIRANHSTIASDDAARVPYQDCLKNQQHAIQRAERLRER